LFPGLRPGLTETAFQAEDFRFIADRIYKGDADYVVPLRR
jgi:hypothetical protein